MIFDALKRWMGRGGNGAGDEGSSGVPSCHEALARMYELLDGELDHLTHEQVAAHFEACRRCYPHLVCERTFRAALQRALEGREAPAELKSRVRVLLDELTAEG